MSDDDGARQAIRDHGGAQGILSSPINPIPGKNQFVFSYTITITNTGDIAAQLVSRHWIITDAEHKVQEVKGLGVVGQQPLLKPGESFEYTSGASIPTAVGTMHGSYQMRAEDGADVRCADSAVHAVGAAHASLKVVALSRRLTAAACAARPSSTTRWPPR